MTRKVSCHAEFAHGCGIEGVDPWLSSNDYKALGSAEKGDTDEAVSGPKIEASKHSEAKVTSYLCPCRTWCARRIFSCTLSRFLCFPGRIALTVRGLHLCSSSSWTCSCSSFGKAGRPVVALCVAMYGRNKLFCSGAGPPGPRFPCIYTTRQCRYDPKVPMEVCCWSTICSVRQVCRLVRAGLEPSCWRE